jgi:DNA polymerase alpha subunit A
MPLTEWNTHDVLSHFSIVRKLDGGIFPVGFSSEVAQLNSKAGSNVLSLESRLVPYIVFIYVILVHT